MSGKLLLPLYLLLALAPLALAAAQGRPPRPFWDEIASGLAIVSFAVLLAEFALSGRFRSVSERIGMDVTMRLHQLLARTALAFALVHPFLYGTGLGLARPWDTSGQLTLGLDPASLATGILAWILLPVLVLLAIYRTKLDWSYERWRLLHGIGAVLVAGFVTHHALEAGRYSQDPLLAGFWLLLLGLALLSLAFVYLVEPLLQASRPYRVAAVRPLALRTWELAIEPVGHDGLDFQAGQFVWLNVGHSPFTHHENPFSIASAPAERPRIAFVIKAVGDFSRGVGEIAAGTRAYLDGPHGNLTLARREGTGIALIAGGVGIAPLLGILRQLRADEDPRPVTLLYGNRLDEQIVYGEELEALAAAGKLKLVHVLSEPPAGWKGRTGLIDSACIAETFSFEGAASWLYFVCGPDPMIESVEAALVALSIPARQIVSERFDYD